MSNDRVFSPHVDMGGDWTLIESGYNYPGHDAIYMASAGGKAAIFDAGIGSSAPLVLQAMEAKGMAPEAAEFLFVSHSHLDHCAGAGHLMAALPNARLLCHERAVEHLSDPSRLVAGARSLYAEDFDALYGEILPVDAHRINSLSDGEKVRLGDRELEVIHTPGHTFDHISVIDKKADCVVTGDAFGIRTAPAFGLPELSRVPAAPTQFAPDLWKETIKRIANLGCARVLVTHYDQIGGDIKARAQEQIDEIDAFVGFAHELRGQTDVKAKLRKLTHERWKQLFGMEPDPAIIDIELLLCSSGIELWMRNHLDASDA